MQSNLLVQATKILQHPPTFRDLNTEQLFAISFVPLPDHFFSFPVQSSRICIIKVVMIYSFIYTRKQHPPANWHVPLFSISFFLFFWWAAHFIRRIKWVRGPIKAMGHGACYILRSRVSFEKFHRKHLTLNWKKEQQTPEDESDQIFRTGTDTGLRCIEILASIEVGCDTMSFVREIVWSCFGDRGFERVPDPIVIVPRTSILKRMTNYVVVVFVVVCGRPVCELFKLL